MVNKIANYLIGSEKSCNTQNSLIRIIEFWTTKLNNRSKFGVTIMDFSEKFDSRSHNML